MRLVSKVLSVILCICTLGCASSKNLFFPEAPLSRNPQEIRYDVNGNGRADFALQADADNRTTTLAYAHEEDGRYDRIYRINDYDTRQCTPSDYSPGFNPLSVHA